MFPIDELREANLAFYDAFESLKLERMDAIWARDASVVCAHPGQDIIVGREQMMASWEAVFANTQYIEFDIDDGHYFTAGRVGWVVCHENITSSVGGEIRKAMTLATNIFERRGGGWKLVHHHASPIL